MTIIGFSGSRTLKSEEQGTVSAVLENIAVDDDTQIHVGDAAGVDEFVRRYYEGRAKVIIHVADWKTHGRAAGPLRNARIIENIDALYAFPRLGNARGTSNAMQAARAKGIPVVETPL